MLSALIPTEHSYPALQLVPKLVDQRFVQPGPLVLGSTSLKYHRLQQIETNLSHACYSYIALIERRTIFTYYYVHWTITSSFKVTCPDFQRTCPDFQRACPELAE